MKSVLQYAVLSSIVLQFGCNAACSNWQFIERPTSLKFCDRQVSIRPYKRLCFDQDSVETVYGDSEKVSADLSCETAESCSMRFDTTLSRTTTFTTSISATIVKELITASVGYSYGTTEGKTVAYTFNLRKGQSGYVKFQQAYLNFKGHYEVEEKKCRRSRPHTEKTREYVEFRVPKKSSHGFFDGKYDFVQTSDSGSDDRAMSSFSCSQWGWRFADDFDIKGHDLSGDRRVRGAGHRNECQDMCRHQIAGCRGYSWFQGHCYFKGGAANVEKKDGVHSAVMC